MKWNKLELFLCACLALASLGTVECKSYNNYKLLSVVTADVDNFKKLDAEWSAKVEFLDDVFESNNSFRIVAHPDVQEDFTRFASANGFETTVLSANFETLIQAEREENQRRRSAQRGRAKESARDFNLEYFWNYEEIMEYVDQVASEFSDIVTVNELQPSLQGRRIVNMVITAPGNSDDRPIIFIDSTIHAREWAAPMTIMYLIRELTENFAEHEEMLELCRFFILPLVNPDGYAFTHADGANRLHRKNMRGYEEGVECWGVDCNRNYDHLWEQGELENVCSIIYAGTAPFSEVEAQNVRDVINANMPKIIIYVSTHTYGGYFMYPFSSTTSKQPENHEEMDGVGRIFSRAVKERSGTAYKVGNGANLLSVSVGTSKDWAYPKVRLTYTLELPPGDGNTGFEISFELIEDLAMETVDGFIELGNYVADNYEFDD